jgi:hypothetical protein
MSELLVANAFKNRFSVGAVVPTAHADTSTICPAKEARSVGDNGPYRCLS